MKINQFFLISNFIENKNIINYNPVSILIIVDCFIKILKLGNYKKINIKLYQYLVKKLIYLLCKIRYDIVFTMSQFNKHNLNPRTCYIKITKNIVKYLKEIMYLRLIYRLYY